MSLLERYEGLRLVWRHFPDPQLHPGADLAAELSELAGTKGKFWDAHSLLLAGRESSHGRGAARRSPRKLGLDPEAAESCAQRPQHIRPQVEEDIADGERAGASGTPTFFIDGTRLVGHWRQLAQAIPRAIEQA